MSFRKWRRSSASVLQTRGEMWMVAMQQLLEIGA
jgi:hypothetical protein